MLSKETITRIKSDSAFAEFRDYVFEEIERINSTDGLSHLSNAQAGEEAKIREKTVTKLKGILLPIIGYKESKDITADQVVEAKRKAGL